MSGIESSSALMELLGRAEAALAHGDTEAAAEAMQSGADLCTRLQAAGIYVPPSELAAMRELADRCGTELTRLTRELQSDSAKGENFRRGMASYAKSG